MDPDDVLNLNNLIASARRLSSPIRPVRSNAELLAQALSNYGMPRPPDPMEALRRQSLADALLSYSPRGGGGGLWGPVQPDDPSDASLAPPAYGAAPDDGGLNSDPSSGQAPDVAQLIPVSARLLDVPTEQSTDLSSGSSDGDGTVGLAPGQDGLDPSDSSQPPTTQPSPPGPVAAPPAPPINPYRTDVFQPGADGKLHPIPGWHTTGPFDFDTWSHNIDWGGVGSDLYNITDDALLAMGAGEILEGLGLRGFLEGSRAGINAHHVDPKFMGGRPDGETYDLIQSFHRLFHARLQPALKAADFPPVGGKTGSTTDWLDFFDKNPGARDKAIEILRQVSRDFDIEFGTSIRPALEKEIGIVKPKVTLPPPAPGAVPPPPK